MDQTDIISSGWHSQTISCPSCNNIITYYDIRKSSHFACNECGTYFVRKEDGAYEQLKTFDKTEHVAFALPLGTTAAYQGVEYILVGQISKAQTSDTVYWDEYLFYSPHDSRYLIFSEYDGHWLLIRPSQETGLYPNTDDKIYYNHRSYSMDLVYKYNITFLGGEFDWNVLNDEELTAAEYVAPPYVLIHENTWDGARSEWYEAVYVPPKDLTEIIRVQREQLAQRGTGIFAFDPSVFYPRWKPLLTLTGILTALIIGLQVFNYITKPTTAAFESSFDIEADTASWEACKAIVTPSFAIKGPGATEIKALGPVLDNDWLELQIVLVNDDNGKLYEVDELMEYYSGVEDGESWKEGDYNTNAIISNVPSGNYHMNIYPFMGKRPDEHSGKMSFVIKVLDNRFLESNLLIILLLVLTYPTIQFIRKHRFENSVWFKGDYTTKTT